MKLSIIIPVYNSEKYLKACLESVFGQNLPQSDYEVIVINDGSTDDSKNIILDFQRQYPILVLIDQENKGVSAARNAGLAIATGDYITFVDSDDYLEKESLKAVLDYLVDRDLEVLYCRIEFIRENGIHVSYFPDTGKYGEVSSGFSHPRRTYPGVFYKKEIIHKLKFHEEISIGEDSLFNAMAQSFAKKVSYFPNPFYCYRDTPNSLSSRDDNERKINEMYLAITELLRFQRNHFATITPVERRYFDGVVKIFLSRAIQWGVLKTLERNKFLSLHQYVKGMKLDYLLDELSMDFPLINGFYINFYIFHKFSRLKSIISHQFSKL